MYELNFSNIPTINIRQEFDKVWGSISGDNFETFFYQKGEIDVGLLAWRGGKDEFFTFLLQRTILGIESYIPAAVTFEAGFRGMMTEQKYKDIQKPPTINSRSTIVKYYDQIPSIIDENWSLKKHDNGLWSRTSEFYKEIRNPLFHGKSLTNVKPEPIKKAFGHINEMYGWIHSWYNPGNEFKWLNEAQGKK